MVADFGYSTLAASDDDLIKMPISKPWNAPEWHHRGVKLSEARAMDVYSFGMLCLWLLFKENKNYSNDNTTLEQLKSDDLLSDFAHQLIVTTTGLNTEQGHNLDLFFNSTLVRDPKRRNLDFKKLLHLLAPNR
jgi:hypothetical protein